MTRILAALLLAAAAARPASGQTILTWEEAVRRASRDNPQLAAAREAVAVSHDGLRAERGDLLPSLSATAGASRAGTTTGFDKTPSDQLSAGVTARQTLFAGGKEAADLRRARADLDAAQADLDSARASVSFDLKSSFARLLFTQEQIALTSAIAARRAENVDLVELRYESGREHRGSFLRSRASRRQAVFEVSQAERALRVSRRELAKALGAGEFDAVSATGTLSAGPAEAPPDIAALVARTPQYRRGRAADRAAETAVVVARSALLPDLSASASASRSGPEWPLDSDRWSAGLSLSLPLFSGGRNAAGLSAARARRRAAEAQLRSTAHTASLDLEDAYAAYRDALERVEVQTEFLRAAEVRAQIARAQYTSGLLKFDDWDIIEGDLISTQKTWLASLRDAVVAEARWERAQGKGAVQ